MASVPNQPLSVLECEQRGERSHNATGWQEQLNAAELGSFLEALESYTPTIPEEVTGYYLQQAGVSIADPKIKKVVSLAAEKLASEIIQDTASYSLQREQSGEILRMENLKQTLKRYGLLKGPLSIEDEQLTDVGRRTEHAGKGVKRGRNR